MEFRLTYEGPLYGSQGGNTRAKHKHEIRKALHPQMRRLWGVHPVLKDENDGDQYASRRIPELANRFNIGSYNFIPLVTRDLHLHCSLDVLFLRPDEPGKVLQSGDLDNRLKTLFDALKIPTEVSQFGGINEPTDEEQPFYVLLEDDSLVTRVNIETDTLLEPVQGGFENSKVRLIIHATVFPYKSIWANVGF